MLWIRERASLGCSARPLTGVQARVIFLKNSIVAPDACTSPSNHLSTTTTLFLAKMSHSIQQDGAAYSYGDAANNASGSLVADDAMAAGFSLLQSPVVWGFSVLVAIVLASVFSGKQKLPPGAKRLPALKGWF